MDLDVSSTKLANAEFYNSFYRALFEEYNGFDELDSNWRQNKDEISEWIVGKLHDRYCVLSVGCGLGYIEQYLYNNYGDIIKLHVSDFSSVALQWLKKVLPTDYINNEAGGGVRFDLLKRSRLCNRRFSSCSYANNLS